MSHVFSLSGLRAPLLSEALSRNRNSRVRRALVLYLHVPRSIEAVAIDVQTVSSDQPDEPPVQVSSSTPPPVVKMPLSDPNSNLDLFDGIYLDGDEF